MKRIDSSLLTDWELFLNNEKGLKSLNNEQSKHPLYICLVSDFLILFQTLFCSFTHLASSCDVVAPVVGSAALAPGADGVGGADALSCAGVTVVAHVFAVAGCRRAQESLIFFNKCQHQWLT